MRIGRSLAGAGAVALVSALGLSADAAAPKPHVTWKPAAAGNYTNASRSRVTGVVIHKSEGANAAGWFANPAASSSTQYDVHSNGAIYQSVAEEDIAWHAGNSSVNAATVGIEHAGFTARNDTTEAQYRASARLTAYLCTKYRIPIDRRHIFGHSEVPDPDGSGWGGINHHTDPGRHWRWDHYLALVRSYAGSGSAPPSGANDGPSHPATLREGSRGPLVATLQSLLRARGFNPGPIDGIFGPLTKAAVTAFKKSRGLPADGVAGPRTWGALGR